MAHHWHYIRSGVISDEQVGPIEESQLIELLRSGEVKPATRVTSPTRTKGEWYTIQQIPSFLKIFSEHDQQRQQQRRQEKAAKTEQARQSREAAAAEHQQQRTQQAQQRLQLASVSDTDQATFDRIRSAVSPLFTEGESILYIAVQQKMMGVNLKQDAAIATNKRLILYRAKLLGRYDFDDYLWRELHDAHLSQGMLGAKFSARHVNGTAIEMDYLSKPGSQRLYRLTQQAEEAAHEYRRQLDLERVRAGATNISMAGSPLAPPSPASQPAPQPAAANGGSDPMQRLSRLKELFEKDLITEEEFRARKQEILAEL